MHSTAGARSHRSPTRSTASITPLPQPRTSAIIAGIGPREDPHTALVAAVAATWQRIVCAIPGAWASEIPGAVAGVCGVPVAMMNGVMVLDAQADPGRVGEMLAQVAASGLPHNVQLRPSIGPELVGVAESAGLRLHHETPLMALQRLDVEPEPAVSILALREIEPAEAELHARIGAEAFGIPTELLAHVSGPPVLSLPEVSCYVGELDGVAVATCLAILIDQHLAIFNVATLEDQRRRGHGAAITVKAVQDGFTRGAHTAWLQSSPMGIGVYERLGFSLIEPWRCWISPAS